MEIAISVISLNQLHKEKIMSDVYVLGVDMIKFGRFPDRTVPNLGAEAALLALDDAGLNVGNMEAFYCGNLGQANAMVGQRILQEIGQTGIPVVNCANACATGATAFREAWTSIKAGLYDVVLAVGVEQMGAGLLGGVLPQTHQIFALKIRKILFPCSEEIRKQKFETLLVVN